MAMASLFVHIVLSASIEHRLHELQPWALGHHRAHHVRDQGCMAARVSHLEKREELSYRSSATKKSQGDTQCCQTIYVP
jgi:hypothetical protein